MASIDISDVTRDQLYGYLVNEASGKRGDWYMHPVWTRLIADLLSEELREDVPASKLDGSWILGRKMHVSEEYGQPVIRRG